MDRKRKSLFFLIILLSLAVYVLSIDFNYIGTYNDDAWYINAARYLAGVQTAQKQLTSRPIGYPVLLVPVARLFPASISVYRITSLVFILSILFMLFYFLRDIFKPDELLIFIALVSLNQYFVILSGDVLAEAPYLFFTFLVIIIFKNFLLKKENFIFFSFLLSLGVSIMFYIKSQGFLIFIAFFIYFLFKKKYRELIYFTFFYLLFLLPGLLSTGSMDKYMMEIGKTYSESSVFKLAAGNFIYYFRLGIYTGLLGIIRAPLSSFMFAKPLVISVCSIIFCFIIYGFIKNNKNEYLKPVRIYLILYLLLQVFWVNVSLRYLIPVFPFLLYYLISGIKRLPKQVYYAVCISIFVFYIHTDVIIVAHARKNVSSSPKRTFETFKWIKKNTEKNSIFYSNFSERLFLRTNRKSVIIDFKSHDEFYYKLIKNRVNYVAVFTSRFIQKSYQYSIPGIRHRMMRLYLNNSARYEKVYEDSNEKTNIYSVLTY